ncbi:MAG: FAD-dependent oxidoreductase, partial [Patescibacteria group bacterium]
MIYDIIIIGSGIVGISAAVYCGRLNLKSLVIGRERGGTITKTHIVENYPGFKSLSGIELADKMFEHAMDYDAEIKDEEVLSIKKAGKNCFNVKTSKSEYSSKTILFCTGSEWKKLNVPGEKEFSNKGVHYCALCDGPLYKNKIVAVVGGGDSAVKEALLLSKFASKVYIIARTELRPEPINLERMKREKKIQSLLGYEVKEIVGTKIIEHVKLNKKFNGLEILKLDGLFIEIGHIPLSELAVKISVELNKKNEII